MSDLSGAASPSAAASGVPGVLPPPSQEAPGASSDFKRQNGRGFCPIHEYERNLCELGCGKLRKAWRRICSDYHNYWRQRRMGMQYISAVMRNRCQHCQRFFRPYRPKDKFCSDRCRYRDKRPLKLADMRLAPRSREVCAHGHKGSMYRKPQWFKQPQKFYLGWRCRECERIATLERTRRWRAKLKAGA